MRPGVKKGYNLPLIIPKCTLTLRYNGLVGFDSEFGLLRFRGVGGA